MLRLLQKLFGQAESPPDTQAPADPSGETDSITGETGGGNETGDGGKGDGGGETGDAADDTCDEHGERVYARDEHPPCEWIGVGLDGTLAQVESLDDCPEAIGQPVPAMAQRVLDWHQSGFRVKILTWRGETADGRAAVAAWLQRHGLPELEVTHEKDFDMVEFWAARGIQVIPNTGKPVGPSRLPATNTN